jgi:hypothetical protein
MKWHLFLARVSYTRSGFSVGSITEYRCDVYTFEGSSLSDVVTFFLFGANIPQWAMAYSFTSFLDHTQRRTTVGRTSLNE